MACVQASFADQGVMDVGRGVVFGSPADPAIAGPPMMSCLPARSPTQSSKISSKTPDPKREEDIAKEIVQRCAVA